MSRGVKGIAGVIDGQSPHTYLELTTAQLSFSQGSRFGVEAALYLSLMLSFKIRVGLA